MDEKTPHLHLTFVPLTKDNRLCAKEIIGNRANLTKWQDDFTPTWWRNIPTWSVGRAPARQAGSISPPGFSNRRFPSPGRARAIEATLDGINPLNAGKKKEEALSMLKKWFSADGELLRATEKVQGHNQ